MNSLRLLPLATSLAIALSLLWFSASSATVGQTWSQTVSEAAVARAHKDLAAAELLLNTARKLAHEPYEKFETSRLFGRFYQKQQKYEQAESELKQCLEMGRTYDYLRDNGVEEDLSELYVRMGRNADAHAMVEASSQSDRADARVKSLLEPMVLSVQRDIKKAWSPPKQKEVPSGTRTVRTICRWLIAQSGEISCLHVSLSSGDKEFDQAALSTIQKLSPCAALPRGSPKFVEIRFSFDYNVR